MLRMSGDTEGMVLDLMELLLTATVVNEHTDLDINDLTPAFRPIAGASGSEGEFKRPVSISEGLLARVAGIEHAYSHLRKNPFVEYDDFGQRLSITAVEPAFAWFLKKGGEERAAKNPVLAYYSEKVLGRDTLSYEKARADNSRYEDTIAYMEARIGPVIEENEEMQSARDLLIIYAPEEIEFSLDDLVCTPAQVDTIKKIDVALKNRDFLKDRKVYEFGKLLFVGPPGTGKTSLALAMSRKLHMPLLEVRLAMITSQYLGETSKNIDRIFELARRLAPCILFIDEFDFVAKSRLTEDNSAMKRAVNMLLKNIDMVSFVRNGVLLIGATNHPALLDEAAWRRFDDVVEFPLPDHGMRRDILKAVTTLIECDCDFDAIAGQTEGFSGADLRMMVKESIISALMKGEYHIDKDDIETGMRIIKGRHFIRENV
jgi:AAA+ superfamily predicted ATPase